MAPSSPRVDGGAVSDEQPPSSTAPTAAATDAPAAPPALATQKNDHEAAGNGATPAEPDTSSTSPSEQPPPSTKAPRSSLPPNNVASRAPVKAPRKKSRLGTILSRLIPCTSSSKAHAIELDQPARDSLSTDSAPPPKSASSAPTQAPPPQMAEAERAPAEKPVSAPPAASVPPPITLPFVADANPPTPPSMTPTEVVIPPSPKAHTAPQSETGGVTSAAVQAPGATFQEDAESQGGSSDEEDEGGRSNGTSAGTVPDEDDEDRLILQGGIGIPIVDGVQRPLLPPQAPEHRGRKCLVLDLDETLLHSSFKLIPQCDYVVPVEIEWQWHNVYVIKRPGVDAFLKEMGEIFEIVVFTASLSKYADPVLDKLDIHKVVSHRLFRESCYNHKGNYVKDLSQLGRPMNETIILDNSPASYIFHPNNAVPVSSWFNDPHDTELTDLCPFLTDLRTVDDIRGVLDGGL